jgi:hypothetical protein
MHQAEEQIFREHEMDETIFRGDKWMKLQNEIPST